MAQYSKKRYYYIKITDHLLTSDNVDFLMTQKDGANYVVLYQMLCLKTANNDGVLGRQLGELLVPYDVQKIARDTKYFTVDTVRVALNLYKQLGLIYELENGLYRLANIDKMVGYQTEGALRKQALRENKDNQLVDNGGTFGGHLGDICPPYKEIEIEIDKDIVQPTNILGNKVVSTHTHTRDEVMEYLMITLRQKQAFDIYKQVQPEYAPFVQEYYDILLAFRNNEEAEMVLSLSREDFDKILTHLFASMKEKPYSERSAYVWKSIHNLSKERDLQ